LKNWAYCLALVFFGLLAFFNAVRLPFVHDDVIFILNNPHIAALGSWREAFQAPIVSLDVNPYYRPILELIYRLEFHFFGPHSWGFHLFIIFVHILNGLLLFRLLKKLDFALPLAWLIACIFLVHPVQTEAVCCISGISNLWMAFGVLLGLNAYMDKRYLASVVFFVIAFFSKEQGILFVPLVVVIDCYRGQKNFQRWLFWGLTAVALLWLRQQVTGASLLKDIMVAPHELYLRLAAVPRDLGMYLRLIFFPYDLHYYRSTDILQPNGTAWIIALASVGGILYVLKRLSLRPISSVIPSSHTVIPAKAGIHSKIILGFGWFFAALLPVLNIAPLINEYSFILTPEHFLYLPVVGVLIIVVCAADFLLTTLVVSKPSTVIPAKAGILKRFLSGSVITACLLVTWHQNTYWSSEIVLFERTLRYEKDFGRGHLLLAKAYYFNGHPEMAEGHFKKAYSIMSSYAKKATNQSAEKFYLGFVKEILFDWAHNDSARGNWQEALDKYKQAAIIDGKDASLYNNMAFVYLHMGNKKDAYLCLKQALRIDPSSTQSKRNLQLMSDGSI